MDDAAAIKRCLQGEKEAFRFLVERYQSPAVAHAVAILRNREDALDAAQEAFVDAYQNLAKFDFERRFYPWFYVLLRNRCFKMIAKTKPAENIDATEILAPKVGLADDERFALETALRNLSVEEREIILLKYVDGLSYDEIAEHLSIPKGTVMSRLFYARKQLQRQMIGKS